MRNEVATSCIVGGGPAGMVAGLLLARQGAEVLVLEKHGDFLRAFRGDTIHPSTLELLAELGWIDEFLQLPHTKMTHVAVELAGTPVTVADFRGLRVRCPYVAFMPQWDFLAFLANKARAYRGFRLMMDAEVTGLVEDAGRVVGVRARGPEGEFDVHAHLVLGADGRHSIVRRGAKLAAVEHAPPMAVLWFRLSRQPGEAFTFFRPGRGLICIDRGAYWQLAYVIPHGQVDAVQAAGLDTLRANLVELLPQVAGRVGELATWDDVRVLRVRVDRLRRWYRPGVLCIGVSWPISPSVSLYAAASYAWCRPPKMGTACTLPGNIARGARPSGASGTRCRRP